jgi:hypothetical protein
VFFIENSFTKEQIANSNEQSKTGNVFLFFENSAWYQSKEQSLIVKSSFAICSLLFAIC